MSYFTDKATRLALDRQRLYTKVKAMTGESHERIVAAIKAEDGRRQATSESFDLDRAMWRVVNDLTGIGTADR